MRIRPINRRTGRGVPLSQKSAGRWYSLPRANEGEYHLARGDLTASPPCKMVLVFQTTKNQRIPANTTEYLLAQNSPARTLESRGAKLCDA